jgi:hypothetical protein
VTGCAVVIQGGRHGRIIVCAFTGSRLVIMAVVPKVLRCSTTFVLAISRHRCPAELQGQHDEHEYDQELFHFLTM